jgi:hypothetical protein
MNVLADREIVELLHEEPELLAIADAVAATQRRRRLLPFVALPAVTAVAAAVALLLVAPWQGPTLVDRALAAVGGGPVLHAVAEYSWPQDVVVDLATGAERERLHRYEYWYDEQRSALRVRVSTDGGPGVDYVGRGEGARLDPVLSGFATQYRAALENGQATATDGRLDFAAQGGGGVQSVVLDPTTGTPLRFYTTYPGGRRSPEWHIVSIEAVPREDADFREPQGPRCCTGEVSDAGEVSLADATSALGRELPQLPGRSLESIELSRTTVSLSDGRSFKGVLVRLTYDELSVWAERDPAGNVVGLLRDEETFPNPPKGSVVLRGNDREGWETELRNDDVAVRIHAPTKHQVLAAARELISQGP